MKTNRDLYDHVVALPSTKRDLATYLRALATLLEPHREAAGIPLEVFGDLLRDAQTAHSGPPPAGEFGRRLWQQADALSDPQVRRQSANLAVDAFLECGAQGAFGGYQAEGEDVEDISLLDWDQLTMFVSCGQYYE